MFDNDGFCYDGAHATWPNESQNGCDQVDYKDKQVVHAVVGRLGPYREHPRADAAPNSRPELVLSLN